MWANSEYTRVEWGKRLAIKRGCDLASWMQLYIRSNSNGDKSHHISLEKLKKWCGYSNGRIDHFRNNMEQALAELVRIGEIKEASIRNDDMVMFTRISDEKSKLITNLDSRTEHRDSNTEHRDSNTDHRDSNTDHRDSNTDHRDSNTDHRDSNTLNHRDSNTLNHRDSNTNHRDSNTNHRDSNTNHRDSNTNHRDSNTKALSKLLKIKKFLASFFL